jgi:hypothetical protein
MENDTTQMFTYCQTIIVLTIKPKEILGFFFRYVVPLQHKTNKVLARVRRVSINYLR